ncbi:GtrA family protein, partial [Streptomyces sp. NPDC007076]|uniref:GtrA family protein n=1 Tax=Streptomyces sp. NPDC007076 TaxID=3160975 RepID=UPI003404450D
MSERGALRARLELLAREVAKFGVVGAVGLVVNIVVSNLLWRYTDIPTVRAGLLATVVAILGNYIGFRYWTYRDRDKSGRTRELTLFLLFSAVGAVIETGVLYTSTVPGCPARAVRCRSVRKTAGEPSRWPRSAT